jgi:putative two-component system response regulator
VLKIMIVDDESANLALLQRIAAKVAADVTVVAFSDPVQALADCVPTLPDLIVTDYIMPGLNGHELLSRVRMLPGGAHVPVVMITAAGERAVRQQALELGATDFLAKPVDPLEVRVRLTNLLAMRRNHLELSDRSRWLAAEVAQATRTIRDREHELIIRLSRAAEFRDSDTGAHLQRMARYSRLIAERLDLPVDACEMIFKAAPMHDIGKMGIPDSILLKQGRLDPAEFEVMKRHPVIGRDILAGSQSQIIALGAEIALAHHEMFDGGGYPQGLAGAAIPQAGRIVAVADVFDALTSSRPYKKAWSDDAAAAFLRDRAGSHFDPVCVEAFLSAWEEVAAVKAAFADAPETAPPEEMAQVLA